MANKVKAYTVGEGDNQKVFLTQDAADKYEFEAYVAATMASLPESWAGIADYIWTNRAQLAPFLKVKAPRKARAPKVASASPAPAAGGKKK